MLELSRIVGFDEDDDQSDTSQGFGQPSHNAGRHGHDQWQHHGSPASDNALTAEPPEGEAPGAAPRSPAPAHSAGLGSLRPGLEPAPGHDDGAPAQAAPVHTAADRGAGSQWPEGSVSLWPRSDASGRQRDDDRHQPDVLPAPLAHKPDPGGRSEAASAPSPFPRATFPRATPTLAEAGDEAGAGRFGAHRPAGERWFDRPVADTPAPDRPAAHERPITGEPERAVEPEPDAARLHPVAESTPAPRDVSDALPDFEDDADEAPAAVTEAGIEPFAWQPPSDGALAQLPAEDLTPRRGEPEFPPHGETGAAPPAASDPADALEDELAAMLIAHSDLEPAQPAAVATPQDGSEPAPGLDSFDAYLGQSEPAVPHMPDAARSAAPGRADPTPAEPDSAQSHPQHGVAPSAAPAEPGLEDEDLESVFREVFDAELDGHEAFDALAEPLRPAGTGEDAAPARGEDRFAEHEPAPAPAARADEMPTAPADGAPGQSAGEETDPVAELSAIMGMADPQDEPVGGGDMRQPAGMDSDFDASFAELDAVFGLTEDHEDRARAEPAMVPPDQRGAPASAPAMPDAPALDMVDMSAYEASDGGGVAVPEMQADEAADDDHGADERSAPAAAIAGGAAAAGVGAATAREARADGTGEPFDESNFEAELARDMEFVGHDLEASRERQGDQFFGDDEFDDPVEADYGERERSSWRGLVIGGVVGIVALGGIGAMVLLTGGEDTLTAGPVLVEADDDPVKVVPDDPGGQTVPNQDRAVFDDGSGAPAQEALVTTAEEPVDIATAPSDGLPAALGTGNSGTGDSAAGEKAEDRLTEGGSETTATAGEIETITPRRVRTLIVRPDGTLEERPAPAEPEPTQVAAAEPATSGQSGETPPRVVETTVAGDSDAGNGGSDAAAGTGTSDTGTAAIAERFGDTAPAAGGDSDAGETQTAATTAEPSGTDGAPAARDAEQLPVARERPANPPAQPSQPAEREVASAPAVTTSSGSSGFTVQLAALPSEADARDTATRLSQRYGGLIAGRGLTIQRAEIEGRGTFYRVRVAADGRQDAAALCERIKASGGNCFVAR
ncbi:MULTISPECIES: SPOR domain-containing protein [unclassified Roseitalea]|uniref:SPOR domain-containing protein n=1 Tax=unclassified Roseitalea TaxID=2639107 RepID=UPI00273DE64C|nr:MULTISPECIES: SPOR domain-containing protein [unclassified Roseitalea]